MKVGLVGFPQVGKRKLFRLLTGKEPHSEGKKGNGLGLAKVRDARFGSLYATFLEIRLGKTWAEEEKNIQKWLASD